MPLVNRTFGGEERLRLVWKDRIPNHAHRTNLSVSAELSEAQTMLAEADAGLGREPNARGGNTHETAPWANNSRPLILFRPKPPLQELLSGRRRRVEEYQQAEPVNP